MNGEGAGTWLDDVRSCIDSIPGTEFTLADAYQFEDELSALHPDNRHVRDKIRQQLQVLRDLGEIEFLDLGIYRKVSALKTFSVTIEETVSESFEVSAASADDAAAFIRRMYQDGTLVLEPGNPISVRIGVDGLPWEEL